MRLLMLEQGQGEGVGFNKEMHGSEKMTVWLANGGNVGVAGIAWLAIWRNGGTGESEVRDREACC